MLWFKLKLKIGIENMQLTKCLSMFLFCTWLSTRLLILFSLKGPRASLCLLDLQRLLEPNKYIAPKLVSVQYGGLSHEGEQEFTYGDSITEEIIKPATKHTIDFPVTETWTLVWEARMVGYEVTYGAEFVPADANGYTVIVQKSRKVTATTDEPVICGSFKCGKPG